jgi:hypothetical protein
MERLAQAHARPAAEGHADLLQARIERGAAPRVAPGQGRRLLGKRPFRTGATPTDEATDPQMHHHRPAADRLVRDAAGVATVDSPRAVPAGRAASCDSPAAGLNMNHVVKDEQALQAEANQMGKQGRDAQNGTSDVARSRGHEHCKGVPYCAPASRNVGQSHFGREPLVQYQP